MLYFVYLDSYELADIADYVSTNFESVLAFCFEHDIIRFVEGYGYMLHGATIEKVRCECQEGRI